MMIDEIYTGSYKGAEFRIKNSSVAGGRKDIKHEFPNSNTQNIEDLGFKPKAYTINAFISEPNYTQKKDRLLAALEEGGTGLLVHPFFGNIENIVSRTYSLNEDISQIGEANFTMTFDVSDTNGLPTASQSSVSVVQAANKALQDSLDASIVSTYKVSTPDSFIVATQVLARMNTAFREKANLIQQVTDKINGYSGLVSDFSSSILGLTTAPQDLADSIRTLFFTVNGLYASAESTVEVFKGFFGFDDDASESPNVVTSSIIERNQNKAVLKSYMQTASLGYAYQNAVSVTYDTTDDVTAAADLLENQFNKVSRDLDVAQLEPLSNLRRDVQNLFDAIKLTTNQVITVRTPETTARALAYQYYGNDNSGIDIIELNDNPNVSFYAGDIKVLSV